MISVRADSTFNFRMTRNRLPAALLLVFAPLAAIAAAPGLPDAGAIFQQLVPPASPLPSSNPSRVMIEKTDSGKMPPSSPFLVQSIQITGNTLIDKPTLLALVAHAEGKTITLPELGELAALITAYYRSHDFPLARAFIPPQSIAQGVVRIEVIEAIYGTGSLENSTQVSDTLLQATLSQLQTGQAISQTKMDHVLLLLSDVPGVLVDATLKPGSAMGSSDFVVTTTPSPPVFGSVTFDNYGNRYTGRARVSGSFSVLNALHHGDTLSVNALTSGRGMHYGRLGYESLLNGRGTRLGAAYSTLNYVLGQPITTDIHGTAQVSSLWAKHPVVRSRDANVYGQIQYDGFKLRDFYASAIQNNRNLTSRTLSLLGDLRDEWLGGGGVNSWNLNWSSGQVTFDNPAAQLADAATANTQGSFSKWNASFVRLQSITPDALLYVTSSAQWASSNLDSSQRMSIGGPYTVRAYDIGTMSGDKGYFWSAEYRHNLGQASTGQWQAVAFMESAHVTVNTNTWPGMTGANSGTLNGIGLGLNWTGPDKWSMKAYLANPVGSAPSLAGSARSPRAWVELVRKL